MAPPITPPRELVYLPLAEILDDSTFRLRPPSDVSSLAQSLAQAGQLFPIELRRAGDGRYQAITGFRRLQALKLLHRDAVLARIHEGLADPTAAMIAAADAIDTRPLERGELVELAERYRSMGWSTPALEELFARAIEKATERLEDLAANLLGEALADRSIPDEDAGEPEEGERRAPEQPTSAAVAKAPAEPPAPQKLGRPVGSLAGAAAPEGHVEGANGVAGPQAPLTTDPDTNIALRDAQAAIAAAQAGVAALEEEVAAAEESMARTAPPALAAVPPLPPEEPSAEVTVDELAEDLAYRLSEISLDLSALVDVWNEVPPHLRGIIADQLKYYSQLGSWLDEAGGRRPEETP